MSDTIDDVDKLLLGESPDRNSEDELIAATRANHGRDRKMVGTNTHGSIVKVDDTNDLNEVS